MIEILKTGLYDTIQDNGRMGWQEFGVPISGVMDRYSATLANSILGNSNYAAVLESVVVGPHLKFNQDTVICIAGADMSVVLNERALKTNTVYQVLKGDILKFGTCKYGCRSYLAVLGGFQTEIQMGSRSMYKGVTADYKLFKGDMLSISKISNNVSNSYSAVKIDKTHFETQQLEVFIGPEFDKLDNNTQHKLLHTKFTISKDSNRMAYQFDDIIENELKDGITSLVLPGTVQLTPSGKLIVLMRDCQTTGGYPRVLQLTEKSINNLGQQFIGNKISFKCLYW
ncbi:biotin-dependent carboxyltransferase family protein [Psychroserpens sp. AS72]|uniref:5-oxoprolinase subunit C family protein n=1 Tax=Psychroserpens sp. AS72 TaxID=3135775 RepID=UPI0031736458